MIVVDVETTNTDPKTGSIISIGAVDFDNPKNTFYAECCIPTSATVDDSALAINGFTRAQLYDNSKPPLDEIIRSFLKWTETVNGDRTLAGHNPAFDRDFLIESVKKAGLEWKFWYRTVDLMTLCYVESMRLGNPPRDANGNIFISSDAVFVYAGMPKEPKPHNALNGAVYEAEAFSRLIYGKNILPQFSAFPVPGYLAEAGRKGALLRTDEQQRQTSRN